MHYCCIPKMKEKKWQLNKKKNIICSTSHWDFQLFIYLIFSMVHRKQNKANCLTICSYCSFKILLSLFHTKTNSHSKPTTFCIFFSSFLIVVSIIVSLCRQCLVCILMSNTHREEAVIKRNKQFICCCCFFLYVCFSKGKDTL